MNYEALGRYTEATDKIRELRNERHSLCNRLGNEQHAFHKLPMNAYRTPAELLEICDAFRDICRRATELLAVARSTAPLCGKKYDLERIEEIVKAGVDFYG